MFRKAAFVTRGLLNFTLRGYEKASASFNPSDLPASVAGRAYLITGANSGIGYEMAKAVLQRQGTVYMWCRNPRLAEEAKKQLIADTGNDKVHVYLVDMSDTAAVVELAKKMITDRLPLHVLINNAGCLLQDAQRSKSGLEMNFAVNVAGTFALTEALLPHLAQHDDARVVTVASGGMLLERLEPHDLQLTARFAQGAFNGEQAYAQQKRQQVVLTELWAQAHPAVTFVSFHPGWSDTPALQASLPDFRRRMEGRLRSSAQGADCGVWLALAPQSKLITGQFYRDRAVESQHLMLAQTTSSAAEKSTFFANLQALVQPFTTS